MNGFWQYFNGSLYNERRVPTNYRKGEVILNGNSKDKEDFKPYKGRGNDGGNPKSLFFLDEFLDAGDGILIQVLLTIIFLQENRH